MDTQTVEMIIPVPYYPSTCYCSVSLQVVPYQQPHRPELEAHVVARTFERLGTRLRPCVVSWYTVLSGNITYSMRGRLYM